MLIGKADNVGTSLCTSDAASITVRGRDLTSDLMGQRTFTEFFFLSVTGREPTADETYFLDVLLVAIAEHGLTPTAQAARMTYDADPNAIQAALAAGILGCGTVVLGTSEECGRLLTQAKARVDNGEDADTVVREIAQEVRRDGGRMAGFGHPVHKPVDPRAERILELARDRGIAGAHLDLAERFRPAVHDAWGKALPMNVSMPIAGVLLDLGFPGAMIKAVPLLARTGGLLAHIAEEQAQPVGFFMASKGEEAVAYRDTDTGKV